MNDNELDDFFRNKAEQPEIVYQPEDWDKLKALLEQSSPAGGKNGSARINNGWLLGLLALVIITGTGLGWNYLKSGEEKEASRTGFYEAQVEQPISKRNQSKRTVSDPPKVPDVVATTPGSVNLSTTGGTASTSNQEIQAAGVKVNQGGNLWDETRHLRVLESLTSRKKTATVDTRLMEVVDHGLKEQPILAGSSLPSEPLYLSHSIQGINQARQDFTKPEKKNKTGIEKRLNVALTFAPDVTALKIRDIAGLGNSIGLNLEYFILPNLSINAGAMHSFKTYGAGEESYGGYVPAATRVDGQCWVLDLPLNIRYYFIHQNLGRWYVSTGLSSYLMLKEKYRWYGGYGQEMQTDIRNDNRHYFDILNLGFGYERVLTDRMALQVEPYLKLPIKGIGEENLELKSAGVLIGLKYRW